MQFPIPSYSHSGEDRLIWKLFGYRATGVYVDVGCYHPVDYSNSYLLYRAGWRGVVIDADEHFLGLYAELRPGDRVRACAIANTAGKGVLFTFPDRSLNTIDEAAAERWQKANPGATFIRQPIEMRPLRDVLDDEAMGAVDFLNIDVEGADLQVLASNDWARWKPSIVAVEDHVLELDRVHASKTYVFLREEGYALHSKCNYTSVYVLP
jgi:FkbM family methyltransferase